MPTDTRRVRTGRPATWAGAPLVSRSERRQNLARVAEIAQVASRHGFGYVLGKGRFRRDEDLPSTRARRVREMLEELGPTFVKFGQLLSTRPDVVPADICAELRQLQDAARPIGFDEVRGVVEAELGLTVEQVFPEFREEPLASASIGQVHEAVLPDGTPVIVKVQRPDAERQLNADIQLLYQIARAAKERISRLQVIDVVAAVDELARSVRRELDYEVEGRNAMAIRGNFASSDHVLIPQVYWPYTTSRVLTMQHAPGTPLSRLDLSEWSSEERERLARRITETWMEMVFLHGFFHADPHPANILVEDADRLSLVDFGIVERLSRRDRENAIGLLMDILDGNVERLPRRLRALGVKYPSRQEEELAESLGVILERYSAVSLGNIDARAVLGEIFQTIYQMNVALPPRWLMLDKTLATLAGVGSEVYPDLDVFSVARPYAQRLLMDSYRPDRLLEKGRNDLGRYAAAFLEYPFQLSDLLDEFKGGEFTLTARIEQLEEVAERLQSAVNRMALAIIAAAFFMGSAVAGATLDSGPRVFNFAVIMIPGVIISIGIALFLIIGMLRSGRW